METPVLLHYGRAHIQEYPGTAVCGIVRGFVTLENISGVLCAGGIGSNRDASIAHTMTLQIPEGGGRRYCFGMRSAVCVAPCKHTESRSHEVTPGFTKPLSRYIPPALS